MDVVRGGSRHQALASVRSVFVFVPLDKPRCIIRFAVTTCVEGTRRNKLRKADMATDRVPVDMPVDGQSALPTAVTPEVQPPVVPPVVVPPTVRSDYANQRVVVVLKSNRQ